MKKFLTISVLFLLLAGALAQPVWGASYDLYVDEDAGSGGDGSSGDPFDAIEDAVEEASSGDEIYVKNGSYGGDFTIGKNVEIKGQSESKVKISGPITMKNGSKLSNVTVTGGYTAITVEEDARVTIDECTVTGFTKMGINIESGNGKLVVKDSKIAKSTGKGFYIQKGNKVELSNNEVYDNDEEGVDIRDHVDGFIVNNDIYDNGESGIEVILGSADLSIKKNRIKHNKSSGIAAQYYSSAKKLGGVKIEGNSIKKNKSFGISCKVPQGSGPSSSDYWAKSLDIAKNEFEENKEGRISSRCKLVEVDEGDGGEEYDEDTTAVEESPTTDAEKEPTEAKKKAMEDEEVRKAEELKKQTEQLQAELNQADGAFKSQQQKTESLLEEMKNRNEVLLWLGGVEEEDLEELESSKNAVSGEISKLEELLTKAGDNAINEEIRKKKELMEEDEKFLEERLAQEKGRFGLWKWVKKVVFWDLF